MTSTDGRSAEEHPGPPSKAGREELLYHTERTRVVRTRGADGSESLIVKEPRGSGSAARVRHERLMIERLAGIDGVPRLSGDAARAGTVTVEDIGGMSLAAAVEAATPTMVEIIDFAIALAGVVAAVHRRGVVHKDINPANIVVSGTPMRPILIDFELASTFAEERPGFTHESQVAGTLAFLAPEQTGRTGRSVDQRADLYSLGTTLYALVTGRPPFGDGEALQLIHAHLARVPSAPAQLNPAVPTMLSEIILRLLEKEPDRRYQSAEGLGHDLSRLAGDLAQAVSRPFPLGERDFPQRLAAPSRLIGRERETQILQTAFDEVVAGNRRSVLVTGAPGVGKTALIDELRPIVTAGGGWFVTGKFDQYRGDADSDGVRQALSALGRLLLAEPDAELAACRTRILDAVGPNAGLIAAILPEFAVLLEVEPAGIAVDDPVEAEARVVQAGVDLLRAVASPGRPVVMVLDDLQWAAATPIGVVDAVVMDPSLEGLLLIGAYRDAEVDATHPLSPRLSRWERLSPPPPVLSLSNLPRSDLGVLLREMLRLGPDETGGLADAVAARTAGNPYDTVELINGLRREGVLVPGEQGWNWDAAAVRGYVGHGDVVDLLAARIHSLPADAQAVLQIVAYLGGQVGLDLLQAATGLSAAVLEVRLNPALEDGLLIMERVGEGAVRFRHDRVQQAAHGTLDPTGRRELHLRLARRLAARPDLGAVAAEQYLPVSEAIDDPDERQRAAALFRTTAAGVRLINPATAERLLSAAIGLLETAEPADVELLIELETERHAALYSLGRLDEADSVYAAIERRCTVPLERADSTCVQISSLSNRNRSLEALELGLDLLRQLGVPVPVGEQVLVEIGMGMERLDRWVEEDRQAADLQRPEITDPGAVAVGKLINRVMPAAYYSGQPIMAWLVVEAQRLWAEYGPSASLVGPISHAGFVAIVVRQDYRTGYRVLRRVLAASEAREYEPQTSQARFLFSLGTGHWFEPLEDNVIESRRAHEGLQRRGDLQNACCTYYTSMPELLDCAPTIDEYVADVDSGLAFAVRVGNDQAAAAFVGYRQLGRALRGDTEAPGSFNDESFDEAAHLETLTANPTAAANVHAAGATAAAIFDNPVELATHAAAMMSLMPFIPGTYAMVPAYLMQALALAQRIPTAPVHERDGLLAEFDVCRDWLAERAADAPGNFLHLVQLVDAERARAVGDEWSAVGAFEVAMREAQPRRRLWHRALITERAARFHLDAGLEHTGRALLGDARRWYETWGATGKVRELDREHPFLRVVAESERPAGHRTATINVSSDAIDLLAVLKASQALSSETNLDRLRLRVVDVLSAMTGATAVRVLLWDDEVHGWFLPGSDDEAPVSVEQAGALGVVPLSAVRYAERTRQPLIVDDMARDDRFANDLYAADLDNCSLLIVPVLTRGELRAMLLLENRLSRGAFSTERLDAVMLIAGQLAVSFDNALVYASLEHKVAERTEALESANAQLEVLSMTDSLTGLANRRRLEEVLGDQWRRMLEQHSEVGVAMIDIDHFKLYNDRYGHVAGDICLRRVAAVINENVRDVDTVARYGGEEFAIILPNSNAGTTRAVAERVAAAVAGLAEPHADSALGFVTVSIGVASQIVSIDTTVQGLVERADEYLYEAKHNGRNQVAGGAESARRQGDRPATATVEP